MPVLVSPVSFSIPVSTYDPKQYQIFAQRRNKQQIDMSGRSIHSRSAGLSTLIALTIDLQATSKDPKIDKPSRSGLFSVAIWTSTIGRQSRIDSK